ncbi:hypothetical protein ACFOLJ_29460 [Rugamonas sp. CCM 8940]|uniref:hypothetical protein n=1 Tax=Rugamonas sp. CCM 8940 TaxID=2765359 RepID=UPI0018F3A51E|nr:hypothetical protein [Rugamonas sp. CCM 8940]MBJ7312957.1 hypothetical protein [Rugamonas sp. CCM 8940]
MHGLLRKSAALLLCVAMSACTTMRVVADGEDAVKSVAARPADGLTVGESLLIVGRDGKKLDFKLAAIEADALRGSVDGQQRRIAFGQIERIERSHVDPGKTAGLIGGAVLLVVLAAARSIGNDIDNIGSKQKSK